MNWGRDLLIFLFGICAGVIAICIFIVWFMNRLKNSIHGFMEKQGATHDAVLEAAGEVLVAEAAGAANAPTTEPVPSEAEDATPSPTPNDPPS